MVIWATTIRVFVVFIGLVVNDDDGVMENFKTVKLVIIAVVIQATGFALDFSIILPGQTDLDPVDRHHPNLL